MKLRRRPSSAGPTRAPAPGRAGGPDRVGAVAGAGAEAVGAAGAGAAVRLQSVSVTLDRRTVVSDVDLEVVPGSWTSIIGPNGAGKTTLLRAVAGAVPYDGTITVDERDVAGLSVRERARLVALVPQKPVIPPGLSVADYVLLGRTPHLGWGLNPGRADVAVVADVLAELDLGPFAQRSVDRLSGGEQQRVVVARALAQRAAVLLLDEPTTALDLGHQQDVLELVDSLRRTHALTVVSTLHDIGLAGQFSDRLALLVDGQITAIGRPAEVITPERLSAAYGADVTVLHDEAGPVVVPRRR